MSSRLFAPLEAGGAYALAFGTVTVEITYHKGRPKTVKQVKSEPKWSEEDVAAPVIE